MKDGQNDLRARIGRLRYPLFLLWGLLWLIGIALVTNPVATHKTRAGFVACVLGLFAGSLAMAWPRRPLRYALLVPALAFLAPVVLPGRAYDPVALRDAYLRYLSRYEGVRYVWGGEKEWGIDCSGLPRRALIRASLATGLAQFNGTLVREGLSLWWHDTSANALGREYRGWTRHVFDAPSVNKMDCSRLNPGDMAVTANGVHVMVFAGGREWLEADPGYQRVIRVQVPVERNAWFDVPVRVVRWTRLSHEPASPPEGAERTLNRAEQRGD